ncbi:C4-dicarboxylate ABC transporter [Synergistales bacterium]|nr:C4-dicarboxylate ABC transporter [Synergistales bacterium]
MGIIDTAIPLNKRIVTFLAMVLSIIHILNVWMTFPSHTMRGLHLAFIFSLIYLGKSFDTKKPIACGINLIELIVGAFCCMYYAINYENLAYRMNSLTSFDKLVGVLLILIIVDATRRTIGMSMAIVTSVFLLYLFYGYLLPGFLNHARYSLGRIVGHMYVGSNGIFGTLLQMSCTYLALFTLLGSFLDACGASNSFISIAMKLTGRLQGGPALAAVVASCLFGMINGSAVVNVVTTGTFTIPMMKELGIAAHVAAAVEAAASTGGQLMPPVMGTGAFIMADITGVPYSEVIVRAAIPALVYFIGVFSGVYFYVKRQNIPKIDPSVLPSGKTILQDTYLLIPMAVVLVLILRHYSPPYAAFWSVVVAVVLIFIRDIRVPKAVMANLGKSLVDGAINLSGVAIGLACAGIITGVVTLTGIGNKFVSLVIAISGGQPFLSLVLVAVACLILGMGLPTSAAYVITATMAVPAMMAMNLPVFACHLFVFYFAVIAPVTPPVAIAAYAGAGIAEASPNKAGIQSFIFALPAFLMPFMFVYNPLLLYQGDMIECLVAGITAIVGAVAIGACTQGYFTTHLNAVARLIVGASALLLIHPDNITDAIGIVGIAGVAVYNTFRQSSKTTV